MVPELGRGSLLPSTLRVLSVGPGGWVQHLTSDTEARAGDAPVRKAIGDPVLRAGAQSRVPDPSSQLLPGTTTA